MKNKTTMTTLQKILEKTKALKATNEAAQFTKILSEHLEDEKQMILNSAHIGYLKALNETAHIILERAKAVSEELNKSK